MLRPTNDFLHRIAAAGLSVSDLAEGAGVSRYTIHKWFQARPQQPRLKTAWQVATLYAKAAGIPDARDAFNTLFIEEQPEAADVAA